MYEPASGSCIEACQDDIEEENDRQEEVVAPIRLGESLDRLQLCGDGMRVDEDYYGIFIETPETVIVEALFSREQGDIDISLLNNLGRVVGAGYSSTDNERIEACLEALPFTPGRSIDASITVTRSP